MTAQKSPADELSRREFVGAACAGAVAGAMSLAAGAGRAATPRGLDICYMKATELAARIRRRELSAVEVMTAFFDRIEAVNPRINAIVSMVSRDAAMGLARQADADLRAGKPVGKLHGLPWAVKDTDDLRGFPRRAARRSSRITSRKKTR